jgi:hypothetical protein
VSGETTGADRQGAPSRAEIDDLVVSYVPLQGDTIPNPLAFLIGPACLFTAKAVVPWSAFEVRFAPDNRHLAALETRPIPGRIFEHTFGSPGPVSLPVQAETSCTAATKQHDGQITKSLSSPSRKNISVAASGKSEV